MGKAAEVSSGSEKAVMDQIVSKPHERLALALKDDLDAVSTIITERMSSEHAPRIPEVTAHLIGGGGKRVRPMLTLAAARICGDKGRDHARKLAATVEFIHTATLLHDDVVDESKARRGRPTANLLWDNKSSVLVGDYLFARAFQLMTECDSMRVMEILSNASATIAEGEVLQLTATARLDTDEDTYIRIVRGKTAALFAAACETGALVAGAETAHVDAFRDYGDALGIAFQIADDLIDWSDAEATGKNAGDDFRERKLTLPIIKAIAAADDDSRAFWTRTIGRGEQGDGDLANAMRLLTGTGALDAARKDALGWSARAKDALSQLPGHSLRDDLSDLADFVVERIA
jgi:octaprenyl-diphosphate synthase